MRLREGGVYRFARVTCAGLATLALLGACSQDDSAEPGTDLEYDVARLYDIALTEPGMCLPDHPWAAGWCFVIETLVDGGACPHPTEGGTGLDRGSGWHRDVGLDDDGRRLCEILPADFNGDGLPDGAWGGECQREEPFAGCIDGWFVAEPREPCLTNQLRFTEPEMGENAAELRFMCRLATLCPERRQCQESARSADVCDPHETEPCGAERLRPPAWL